MVIKEKSQLGTKDWIVTFLDDCRLRSLSEMTIKWYRGYLNIFARKFSILPMNPETLQVFIGNYGGSDHRRNGCYRTLKCFYNFIEMRQDDFINPIRKGVRAPKVKHREKRALTLEELKQLLEYPDHTPIIRSLMYFISDTGCRIGEAAALVHSDIYQDTVRIDGKTGIRIVPISPRVKAMLLALPGPNIFPYCKGWLGCLVSDAFKTAGVKGTAHTLRHTFCTLWKGDTISLRKITGHTSEKMLENYRHHQLEIATRQHSTDSPLAQLYPEQDQDQVPDIEHSDNGETARTNPLQDMLNSFDNGNGKKERINPIRESLRVHPTDDLLYLMRAMDEVQVNCFIATAKFILHSSLYNAGRQLVEATEKHIEKGTFIDFMDEAITTHVMLIEGFDETEEDERAIAEAVLKETKQIWKMILAHLESFTLEHYSQALAYRNIGAFDVLPINKVTVLTPDYYNLGCSDQGVF